MCTVLKLRLALEGNREADMDPGENEFDTPGLGHKKTCFFLMGDEHHFYLEK